MSIRVMSLVKQLSLPVLATLCVVFALPAVTAAEATRSSENITSVHSDEIQTRLDTAKMQVCLNRQQFIGNTMLRIDDRAQKQLNLFTSIAQRAEDFYVKKGKTLDTYTILVGEVNAKKATAQSSVAALQSAGSFSCEGDDPKGDVQTFRTKLQTAISDLQAYKTSIKNLIAGIRSVQSGGNAQ